MTIKPIDLNDFDDEQAPLPVRPGSLSQRALAQNEPPYLKGLNPEQRAAVETTDGPLLVLAGAGTGKTRVIVARFHHLVAQGVRPERILALTFSRAAAASMRRQVVGGLTGAGRLWVSTFHSFCLRLLQEEQGESPRLLQEPEAIAILAGLIDAGASVTLKADEAHSFIGQAKDQLIAPEEASAYARAAGNERLAGLAALYARFQAELAAQGAAEFADFISQAVHLLQRDAAVASRWQGRFDHILVDEFQDANHAQFRVLQILMQPHGNLMVVGDDDQAIYRFRGATDRYMLRFHHLIPGARDYQVQENFRCPEPVLQVANRLIKANGEGRVDKQLYTRTKTSGYPAVRHLEAPTEREEADAVALEIERRIRQGRRPGEIAILLRSLRRSGGEFARALSERSIPYRLMGEEAPHPAAAQTLALLRLTRALTHQDLLAVLAGRVPPAELYAGLRQAGGALAAWLEAGAGGSAAVQTAYAELKGWLATTPGRSVAELTYEALRFLGHLRLSVTLTAADQTRLAAARRLQEAAAQANSLDELLTAAPEGGSSGLTGGGVTLMTIHAAKGLQFPVVYVGALAEGRFPVEVEASPAFYVAEAIRDHIDAGAAVSLSAAERQAQHLLEERRLAYVALTRAEAELTLTRAQRYGGEAAQPSRFLLEMQAPPPQPVGGQVADPVSAARAFLIQAAEGARPTPVDQVEAAAAILRADGGAVPLRRQAEPAPFTANESLRLSASALETYRDCPRKYYYAYVLGLPQESNIYLAFGSALHDTLERFNRARMTGLLPDWPALHALWAEQMQPGAFESAGQFAQLAERGRIFLARYHTWLTGQTEQVLSVEGSFDLPYVDGQGREHRLRGRYDAIVRDAEGGEVIIDYKSGSRNSTGVNKRPTRGSAKNPDRKLQLGLYYLARHGGQVSPGARVAYILLRHSDDKPPRHFAQQFDEKGEQYIACSHSAESLSQIRADIDRVIDGILANDFTRQIDDWKCRSCPFVEQCEVSSRGLF